MTRRLNRTTGFLLLVVVLAIVGVGVYLLLSRTTTGTARTRPSDETEVIGDDTFLHYFTEVDGINWHHVELGEGEPIVFLHGIPGAWYSWHKVMSDLSPNYRTIAVDLKGLGLTTTQTEGSYSAEVVASELMALMDELGIERFALVSHEWGSMIASYVSGNYPERVTHFVRMQTPTSDAAISQIQTLLALPQIGAAVLGDGDGFVRRLYTGASSSFLMNNVSGPVVVQPIDEMDIARISKEFSYEGIPDAIIHYYQDTPQDYRTTLAELAATTTIPVLLLQADGDPIQPVSAYEGVAAQFPNATFTVFPNSGQVPMLEQPDALAETIRTFLEG